LKTRVIACVSNLLARLRDAGLHHRDLKASNILLSGINAADAECRPVILDLDGLRLWTLRQTAAERFRLTRLAASLLQYKSITCADYARFLRSYLRASQRTDNGWRWWFREISRRASNYNRKAQGRKPDKLDGYTG
jgi:serine/threonine protein kinase